MLVLLGFFAYAGSLNSPFVFDDFGNIGQNPAVQSFDIAQWFSGVASRRVLIFTFALNYAWGGLNTFGYHVTNLAIHIAAAIVLWRLLLGILRHDRVLGDDPAVNTLAWFTAAAWLVHPLQTESVTYLVQRAESLMGLFFLVTLWCVLRGAMSERAWPWYVVAVISTWLGMGVKEVMVTVLPVVLVMDHLLTNDSWRERLKRRGWLYLGMMLALASYLRPVSNIVAGGSTTAGFGLETHSGWQHLLSEPQAILLYLRLSVWPWPQCFDYNLPAVTEFSQAALPGLVVLSLLTLGVVGLYRRKIWALPVLAFFLVLAPTSSFVPIMDIAAEHRMYLPLACVLSLLIVGGYLGLRQLLQRAGHVRWQSLIATALALIVLVTLATSTIARNHTYKNELVLWADVVRTRPDSSRAHNNLGAALLERDELDLAESHLRRALELAPPRDHQSIQYNLARTFLAQGKPLAARELLAPMVSADPLQPESRFHLGLSYLMTGHLSAAILELQQIQEQRPAWPILMRTLGEAYLAYDQPREAMQQLAGAQQLQPTSIVGQAALTEAFYRFGDNDRAVASHHTLRSMPIPAEQQSLLEARLELARGKLNAAEKILRHVVEQQPNNTSALWQWIGVVVRRDGDTDLAPLIARLRELTGDEAMAVRQATQLQIGYELWSSQPLDPLAAQYALRLAYALDSRDQNASLAWAWYLATTEHDSAKSGKEAQQVYEALMRENLAETASLKSLKAAILGQLEQFAAAEQIVTQALSDESLSPSLKTLLLAQRDCYQQQRPWRDSRALFGVCLPAITTAHR
jgi:Flp pilus assembly protein TadD